MPYLKLCLHCGKEWSARTDEPRRCGVCKTPNWHKPKRIPKPRLPAAPVGKPLKYPQLGELLPGSRVLLAWAELPDGRPDFKTNATFSRSAFSLAKRRGWKIRTEAKPEGLWVIRIE